MKKILLIIIFIFLNLNISFAHPWRTSSDWCHYCRTNCDKRWVARNARHCHWWSSSSYNNTTTTSISTIPSCPSYSTYSSISKSCVCNNWYTPSFSKNSCIKIPTNAYAVNNSKNDLWKCYSWYKEVWKSCVLIWKKINNIQKPIINSYIEKEENKTNLNENNNSKQYSINNSFSDNFFVFFRGFIFVWLYLYIIIKKK